MPVAHGNDKPHYMLPVQFLPAVRHEYLVSNDYSTSQGAPDGPVMIIGFPAIIHQNKISA